MSNLKKIFEKKITIEDGFVTVTLSDDTNFDGYGTAHINVSGVHKGQNIGFTLGGDYKNLVPMSIFHIFMYFERFDKPELLKDLKTLSEELTEAGFCQFENFG